MCVEELLLVVGSLVISNLPAIIEQANEFFEKVKPEVEKYLPTKF